MSEEFDPYLKWLGIPVKHQPPNHYRLLGLENFEPDPDVIESAADRQMAHVRTFRAGKRQDIAEKLLNELAEARVCLLTPEKKTEYDAGLRAKVEKPAAQATAASPARPAAVPPKPAAAPPKTIAGVAPAAAIAAPPAGPMLVGGGSSSRARRQKQPAWLSLAVIGVLAVGTLAGAAVVLPGLLASPGAEISSVDTPEEGATETPAPPVVKTSVPTIPSETPPPKAPETPEPPGGATSGPLVIEAPKEPGVQEVEKPSTPISTSPSKEPEPPATTPEPKTEPAGEKDPSAPRTLADIVDEPDDEPKTSTPNNVNSGATQPAKLAAPTATKQSEKEAQIRSLYEIPTKPSADEQRRLARRIIDDGMAASDNMEDRFVLLRMGAEMAAAGGDIPQAMAAIDAIEQSFQIDAPAVRLKLVADASKATLPPAEKSESLQAALPVLEAGLMANRYSEVESLSNTLLAAARRLNNKELNASLVEKKKAAVAGGQQYEKAKNALAKLQESPDDPQANLIVGSFWCFAKQNWEKGLPYLVKGSDYPLADAAKRDLSKPSLGSDRAKLGEDWHARAQKEDQPAKSALLVRAAYWLRLAQPDVTGLAKASVDRRLAEIEAANAAITGKPATQMARIVASGYRGFDMYLNGELILRAESDEVQDIQHELKAGDIITVLAKGSRAPFGDRPDFGGGGPRRGPRSFAAVVAFEGSEKTFPTAAGGVWQHYVPRSLETWYDPAGITTLTPAVANEGNSQERVFESSGLRSQSVWGPVSFGACFVLRIP